jgi:predicted CXXCH cytochrome family protein
MKGLKLSLVIITAFLAVVGLSNVALAYHSGGVADCDGCHTMHGVDTGGGTLTPTTQNYLLQHSDPSSTCLGCHGKPAASAGSYHVMTTDAVAGGTTPANYNPAGDFGWLLETYNYTLRGTATVEQGQDHGHNVVAADYNIQADTNFQVAPGGTFKNTDLACISCHDPHGKYRRVGTNSSWTIGTPAQLTTASLPISGSGSTGTAPTSTTAVGVYRLLAGLGYSQTSTGPSIPFPGVPIAVAPGSYGNVAESATSQNRVAYSNYTGSGATTWGQWCGACHTAMVGGLGAHVHPIDVALHSGGEDAIYGAYVSSGVMTGTLPKSYLSLVPFMATDPNIDNLKALAGTGATVPLAGPTSTDQVSCLSCHRAHASGFPSMMRWNMQNEFLTVAGPVWQIVGSTTQGRTTNEANAAYNGRLASVFGASGFQRVLCNKCHAQD